MTKNTSATKITLAQAAPVVALRQYIPTQNGAAKSMGTFHVSCNCSNTSISANDITTAPAITITPVIRPSRTYCRSVASGLR